MPGLLYTVIATLPDETTRSEYIAWLREGHIDAVLQGGADSGMIVRIEQPATPLQVETRYVFSTRALFERYLREHAPRLRADGLARFGPDRGITFERRVGEIT
jgi:hypothetical protein